MNDTDRVAVWEAMADHFLDTETRQDLARTAWRCVQAGLTVEQAARVWRDEVCPAVGWNLWQVAGEWAGWDTGWLVGQIEKQRASGPFAWLRLRPGAVMMGGTWKAIAACMQLLREAPEPEALMRDLSLLAGHFFDFCPQPLPVERRNQLQALYPTFLEAFSPALVSGEAKEAERRVREALGLR